MAVNQCQTAAVSNGVLVQEKLAKVTGLDERERHCSLEILPILFEKTSFPFQNSLARDSSSFLSTEGFDISPDKYDIDKDKLDKLKTSKSCEGSFESLRTESTLVRIEKILQRQSSLKMGAKLMQYLLDHGLMLLKFSSKEKSGIERAQDASNNRWRKYKRSASFDSRKIVVLFSVLSSLGTLILIYLTLRVRQQGGDGSVAM
ncbi:hypothetical protein SDJN03_24876, partial [Cucurbita argyrosperma subsp. sororia]